MTNTDYTIYVANTPNGQKPVILLEELGINYDIKFVNFAKQQQHDAEYVKLNPNGKIPTLVDHTNGNIIFESAAILMYLAEKHEQFLPKEIKRKYEVIEWLFFQMSAVGPMMGQLGHFKNFAQEQIPYAINRYETEVNRLLKVLDIQLEGKEFIAGEYSIADINLWTWINSYGFLKISLDAYPSLKQWHANMAANSKVQSALAKIKEREMEAKGN